MRKSFLVLSMLVLSLFSVLPLSVSADIAVTPADSIQDAIDAIEDGGTIYIGAGTYHVNLVINNPGKSFSMVAADGPGTVVLDGSASGSVIFVQDTNGHTITLDGLTITNGSAHGGGGMYDRYSTVIVTNCTFHDNEAYSYYGGGVFNYYSDASFTNCTFHNNYTYSDGGGMDSDYGVVTVTNCAFYENYAENAGGGTYNYLVDITYAGCTFYGNEAYYDGGGMYNDESSPTIMDSSFEYNYAYYGGGMYNYESYPIVLGCSFDGNEVYYDGGGMYNDESSPTIMDSSFEYNYAYCGGGIYNYESYPIVMGCSFDGNEAYYYGGGICNYSTDVTVTNCFFASNGAYTSDGGAFYVRDSNATVTNCVFEYNFTASNGGAMFNYNSVSFNPIDIIVTNCTFYCNTAFEGNGMYNAWIDSVVTNCIFWDGGNEIQNYSCTPIVTYCDVQGGYVGEGNIDSEPIFTDAGGDDLSLFGGSPCIDTGTDASIAAYGSVTDDITGLVRPQYMQYDMGAYEYKNSWTPNVLIPLVSTMQIKVNSLWQCLQQQLPSDIPEELQVLLDEAQEHMANAKMLSNPIYANGEINRAMALLEQVSEMLDCGCHLG